MVDDVKREYEIKLSALNGELEKLRFDSGQKAEYFKQKVSRLFTTIFTVSQCVPIKGASVCRFSQHAL